MDHKNIPERNILDLRKKTDSAPAKDFQVAKHEEKSYKKPSAHAEQISDSLAPKKKKKANPVFIKYRSFLGKNRSVFALTISACCIALCVASINVYQSAQQAKAQVTQQTQEAFEALLTAQTSIREGDTASAKESVVRSEEAFTEAYQAFTRLKSTYTPLSHLPPLSGQLANAEHILIAGKSVATIGVYIKQITDECEAKGAIGYKDFFAEYQRYGGPIVNELERAKRNLDELDATQFDETNQQNIKKFVDAFSVIYGSLSRVDELLAVLNEALGFNGERTYLMVFQNNQELRPTGGFIGSVAHVSTDNGEITALNVPEGGSYDVSGLSQENVQAPQPLLALNKYLEFHDMNWFSDFPESAVHLIQAYESATDESVDGIMSFTPDVLQNLLDLTGPIDLTIDGTTIEVSSDSLLSILRADIEDKKSEGSQQPKRIIGEMMPVIIQKAFNLPAKDQVQLAVILDKLLREKDILIYAEDSQTQARMEKAGVTGSLTAPKTDDALAVVEANIRGGKTDRSINRHITMESTEMNDGFVYTTVTLTHQHTGGLYDTFVSEPHVSYVRFYVPQSAEFVEAEGFTSLPQDEYFEPDLLAKQDPSIARVEASTTIYNASGTRSYDEYGMKVFANWVEVEQGQSTSASLTYRIPDRRLVDGFWTLGVRQQPGLHNVSVTWIGHFLTGVSSVASSIPSSSSREEGRATASFDLNGDAVIETKLGNSSL